MIMKNYLLLVTATIGVFSLMVSGEPGVTYYVKPSQSTECPGQPCETLNYYLKNVKTTINQEKNLTMIFLNGNHSLYFEILTANPPIKTAVIRMIGANNNVLIKALSVSGYSLEYHMSFVNNNDVSLQNLVVIDFKVVVTSNQPKSILHMSSLKILNFTLDISIEVYMENIDFEYGSITLETAFSVMKECKYRDVGLFIQMSSFIRLLRLEIENCNFSNTPFVIHKNATVIVSGTTIFADAFYYPAISSYYGGNLTLSGNVTFANNNATRGGALALYFSTVYIAANTSVTFLNNFASHKGGAIYVEPGISPNVILNLEYDLENTPYFYHLLNCDKKNTYNFNFTNNLAMNGGYDIYGDILTKHLCSNCNLTVSFASSSNSSVSSDALRVCMCDSNGQPQCKDNKYNNIFSQIHAGEVFKISAVLVGGDFGLTTGTIYADIYPDGYNSIPASLTQISQYSNLVTDIRQCKDIEYSLYPNNNTLVTVTFNSFNLDATRSYCIDDSCSQTATVIMKFTILPCPPGFNLTGNPSRCDCSDVLTTYLKISCQIINGEGNFMWTGNPWMNISENNDILYTENCPHNYCKNFNGTEKINLGNDSAYQCEFNRRGRLCGRCKEGYSLAIGSSHCIHCVNNNNLALLIFFAAAGFLLVLFVGLLNLTVTTGTLSGLIFYANIIWTYKDVFFECEGLSCTGLIFLKTFIAWVNLDFGIETCFVKGLTAFWKTWLQFIFPFYLWAITGLIILASRYSFRLTKLLGNRAVPLLATLILLSYMKLVRTVVSILEFSVISTLPFDGSTKVSSEIVWSLDGTLSYFDFPHVFLFVAGLFTLLFLWLPYTLLLFLMQWLRRLPHVGIIKWIMRLYPFYDSYFAPLKPKHQYWFGVLLLARGILLVTFASGLAFPANVNLLLILVFATLLSVYMARIHPYKNRATLLLNGSYILNLTLLSGFFIFTRTQPDGATLRPVAIGLSTGVTFLQFCGTVLTAIIKPCCFKSKKPLELTIPGNDRSGLDTSSSWYRDSILNDGSAEPLLPTH